ncbi:MAG: YifB family Mg chelatase-like AAA ATPase [Patescibacteria group bacterium]|jgi:magnesium chelatase family protein
MLAKLFTAALTGLDASIVAVEADSGGGDFGQITIVGLPDAAISEAKERVRSALRNCGLPFPRRKITVNLAPADLKKHGPAYDLPIAISILAIKNKIEFDFSQCLIIGELSLAGEVRAITGALPIAISAKQKGIKNLFLPEQNGIEANMIKGVNVFPVKHIAELIKHLQGKKLIAPLASQANFKETKNDNDNFDLINIIGQEKAKRALEITAAGGHNLLFFGPPGSGKTLLAKTIPSILPKLSWEEKLEITKIYSAAGKLKNGDYLINSRPFRSPHHSSSGVSLVGGGAMPQPGEISLAHRGVLFLDEFPEFSRSVLENLRQPLEEGIINISRAAASLKFPAKFMLIAAMNPCPCGYYGDARHVCRCSPKQIHRYRQKLSGPIIDRIDLHVEVPRIALNNIARLNPGDNSQKVRKRIEFARKIQAKRFKNYSFLTNAEMTKQAIDRFCPLKPSISEFLNEAAEKLNLSARSYYRILKLSRTIADLENKKEILIEHLAEALQYRPKI